MKALQLSAGLLSLFSTSAFAFLQLAINASQLATKDSQRPMNSSQLATNDPGNAVKTSSGLIQGHNAPNRQHVTEYLGIPFAKPPVGNLRFAAPQPYRAHGLYKASTFVCRPRHIDVPLADGISLVVCVSTICQRLVPTIAINKTLTMWPKRLSCQCRRIFHRRQQSLYSRGDCCETHRRNSTIWSDRWGRLLEIEYLEQTWRWRELQGGVVLALWRGFEKPLRSLDMAVAD